jgi:hypothetical protein
MVAKLYLMLLGVILIQLVVINPLLKKLFKIDE